MGAHYGPRATLDYAIFRGVHALASYGEGFRSPQARSLGDGEKTPFTTVRSMEAGLRYTDTSINASVSMFRTTLSNDLVFDAATTRNEEVPASRRIGGALEFVIKPAPWFVSSGSGTYTRATFTQSDRQYNVGDRLPYVPELVIRQDLAFLPSLGQALSRPLTGRFGASLTGMFDRPQPYGQLGHDVFLIDAVAELRLKEVAVGLDVFNLLDTHWYDSEFTYSANWNPGAVARLVPERYVTVGAPRTLLATLSLFVN
jgi:outer membrane receptor protein involved in Fe transport